MRLALIGSLAGLALFGCAPTVAGEDALLPPDGFRQAWKKSGSVKVFASADLYGYIDGGAEIFFEFGFDQLHVQTYDATRVGASHSAEIQLKIEIYRMIDPTAAAGIYYLKCGKETPDPHFKERHTINRFQMLFKRDRYFVLVNNVDGSEAGRPGMLDFARYISGGMPVDRPLALLRDLPREGLIEDSIRLIRGPFGMQSIYTLGEGDILQLRPDRIAVAARYRDTAGEHTRIFADYRNAESARSVFANLRKNLDSYLRVQSESADSIVFKDYAGKYGKISWAGSEILIVVQLSREP